MYGNNDDGRCPSDWNAGADGSGKPYAVFKPALFRCSCGSGRNPVIFPLLEAPQSVRSVAERLDGLLLTGSNRIWILHFMEQSGPISADLRSLSAIGWTFYCGRSVKRKIPILAICFGFQSLNIFWGGSLIQDIRHR